MYNNHISTIHKQFPTIHQQFSTMNMTDLEYFNKILQFLTNIEDHIKNNIPLAEKKLQLQETINFFNSEAFNSKLNKFNPGQQQQIIQKISDIKNLCSTFISTPTQKTQVSLKKSLPLSTRAGNKQGRP